MPLKDRIAEAIEGSGKSKADIARACDVTNAAITHWLNGETANLKADKALALEVATGYRAHWILSGKGPKKADEPYWPFSLPMDRFTRLGEKQQGYVEARLEEAIEKAEGMAPTPPPSKSSGHLLPDRLVLNGKNHKSSHKKQA